MKDAFGEDETAGRFFSDAPVFLPPEDVHLVEEERVPMPRAVTAAQRARRRTLRRYVTAVVGLAAALCFAAGIHATGRAAAHDSRMASLDPPPPQRAAAVEDPPAESPTPTAPEAVAKSDPPPAPPSEPRPTESVAAPASPEAPAAAASAGAAAPAPESPSAEPASPTPDPQGQAAVGNWVAAVDAKHASQKALEGGHFKTAIEAGEKSVELDPTDAEAWLILGAAYMQRGSYAEARRRFASCVEQAKHGPKGECAALLR